MKKRHANSGSFLAGPRPSRRMSGWTLAITAFAVILMTYIDAHATPGEILLISGEDVALRAAPGARSQIVERLDKHDRIMEFERRDGWVRGMLFGAIGKEGWVAARYLTPESDAKEAAPSASSDRTPDASSAGGTEAPDEGGAYGVRTREPARLYCLDCFLPRRHDARRHGDHRHSDVRDMKRRHGHDRTPSPVIRVVPPPAPVWGAETRR